MPIDNKLDPFKPQQPQIPGVPAKAQAAASAAHAQAISETPRARGGWLWPPSLWPMWFRIGLGVGAAIVVAAIVWRARVSSATSAEAPAQVEATHVEAKPAGRAQPLPVGPGEIARARELGAAWSSKQFLFRNPLTSEIVPALAVRLPGGALWGISMREPFGNCQLEYVKNLSVLLTQYNFHAQHPMVVNPCSASVYDLAQYTGGPNGLVRGRVVQGTAIRAPFAIEVVQRGKSIFAVRMESTP